MSRSSDTNTPRIVSTSPTPPADLDNADSYFAPSTRSSVRRSARLGSTSVDDYVDSSDPESRARTRSRDVQPSKKRRSLHPVATESFRVDERGQRLSAKPKSDADFLKPNGHLSPPEAARNISRSPSPLGLIPIHQHARVWVHKHEVPRKALHVSIGFLTLGLYGAGYQSDQIHPVLMTALVPIAAADVLRRNWPAFNRVYIQVMGAFMRESEAHERYNGVIFYLIGAWTVLRFFPKDIGVMGVVLLSWCDTAASTFGRLYGRYTPKVRQGKSLAGSAAAFIVGVGASLLFYGWIGPYFEANGQADNTGVNAFAYSGTLTLPETIRSLLGWSKAQSTVGGGLALGIMSYVSGLVASVSEAVDIFGWDDNLTIPILSGIGLWAFLKAYGSA